MKTIIDTLKYAEKIIPSDPETDTHDQIYHEVHHIKFGFHVGKRTRIDHSMFDSITLPEYRIIVFRELTHTMLRHLYGDLIDDYVENVHLGIRRTTNPDSILFSIDKNFLEKWYPSTRAMPSTFNFKILDDRSPEEYDMLPR